MSGGPKQKSYAEEYQEFVDAVRYGRLVCKEGMEMTDLIERAKAALEGATPGPWRVEYNHGTTQLIMEAHSDPCQMCDETYYPWAPENDGDWHLIALSPDLARLAVAAGELADAAKEARNIANLSFAAGAEEREGGSGRRQGKLVDDYERRISAINDILARFRAIAEDKTDD